MKRFYEISLFLALTAGLVALACPVFAQQLVTTIDRSVTISRDGEAIIDGKPSKAVHWDILSDRTVFRYKVIDTPGQEMEGLRLAVHLPTSVDASQVKANLIAVHGVEGAKVQAVDDSTLLFTSGTLSPYATITVTIDFPPSAISFNSVQRLYAMLQRLSLGYWLAIASVLPVLSLLAIGFMTLRRWSDIFVQPAEQEQTLPPSTLSPALVGVLINGVAGTREIAATLIDLAQRGYIDIIYQGENNFGFSQKRLWRNDPNLTSFERPLLEQLFPSQDLVTSGRDINQKLNAHIWSDSVTQSIEAMYEQMQQLGYYQASPRQARLIIRFIGMAIFFLSAIGLGLSFWLFNDKLYVTIPWVVSLFLGPMLTRAGALVSQRTVAGRQQAEAWLAFRDYLAQPFQARYQEELDLYERYLAYAIALSVESSWTARYAHLAARIPNWFFSQGVLIDSFDQLATALFSIIGFVGGKFAVSRKPTAI